MWIYRLNNEFVESKIHLAQSVKILLVNYPCAILRTFGMINQPKHLFKLRDIGHMLVRYLQFITYKYPMRTQSIAQLYTVKTNSSIAYQKKTASYLALTPSHVKVPLSTAQ